jgi:hypothetical protein
MTAMVTGNGATPRRRVGAAAVSLVGYVTAVVVLTWPLGAHLTSHRPNPFPALAMLDGLFEIWTAAWTAHALTTAPLQLLDANIFHPTPQAFFLGGNGIGVFPYFAPTFVLTGNPALAANVTFLGCVALTAWGLHRVVVSWTTSELAGLIAGATFLETPWVLWAWLPITLTYDALLYFPWLIALTAAPTLRPWHAAGLAVLVALQCVTNIVYVAPAVLVPLGVIVLARLLRRETRSLGLRGAIVLLAAVAMLVPLYAGYASVAAGQQHLVEQRAWDGVMPQGLAAFEPVIMARRIYLPVRIPWGRQPNFAPIGVPQIVFPLVLCGLACFLLDADRRARLRRAWLHAGVWTLVGALISMPVVKIWNLEPMQSPLFILLERVAPRVLQVAQSADRLGVAALMGIALLAGLAFAACERRVVRRGRAVPVLLAALLVGLMWGEWRMRVRTPYPIFEPPRLSETLLAKLREPGGPLLEVPVGRGRGRVPHSEAMYRSIFHWRRLVNGRSSYVPSGFQERMAVAEQLPSRDALTLLRAGTGLDTILVNIPSTRDRSAWLASADPAANGPLHLIAQDGDALLFTVRE